MKGSVVAGRYEILNVVGKGGMGTVYRAHDQTLDEVVALKVLRADIYYSEGLWQRFRSEIKLARKVRHVNVCGIHEYGEENGLSYIAMEFLEGVNLRELLKQRGALPAGTALDIAIQVAAGLEAVHAAGIIHRDLKTPNLMIDTRGHVRLMDFGIAKSLGSTASNTATGQIIGTPEYMSPEQSRGQKIDTRSDIYALGVVIFELFTADVPFRGDSPVATIFMQVQEPPPLDRVIAVGAPPAMSNVLSRALAKDPNDRYATVGELAEALRAIRSTLPQGQSLLIPLGEASSSVAETTGSIPHLKVPPPAASYVPPPPSPAPPRLRPTLPASRPPNERTMQAPAPDFPTRVSREPPRRRSTDRAQQTPGRKAAPAPEGPWSVVGEALPQAMAASEAAVRGLLATVFGSAILVRPGLLRLREPKLLGSEGYEFFALFMGESVGSDSDSGEHLGTGTFVAYASPLELHLATLPSEEKKGVIVVADAFELGRGVRERILQYRQQFNAVVVPLCLAEVRKSYRESTLRALVDDRLADLHTPRDLFRARGSATDPTTFFGMRDEVNQLVALLQRPDAFVVISGPPGSGKSSLVRMAEDGLKLARFWRLPCANLTRRSIASFVDDVAALLSHAPENATVILEAAAMAPDTSAKADRIASRLAQAARQAAASGNGRPVLVLEDANWLIDLLYSSEPEERSSARELWTTLAESARSGLLPIVVTGVRAFLLNQRRMDGWENPLASQATIFAVPPLGAASVRRMVSELAVQMNTAFEARALEDVFHLSGGNVEVVRHLCSAAVQTYRRECEDASLAPVLIDRRRVRRAAEKLAAERSTFRSLEWLGERERQILQIVADRRPRSPRALRKLLPDDSRPVENAEALERLRHMGLVEHREGRERVAIPLLEAWVRENEESASSPRASDGGVKYRWLVLGLTTTVLLCAGYWSWYRTTTITTPLEKVGACRFEIQHPNRGAEGQPVTMSVSGACGDSGVTPEFTLRREMGTLARANGEPAAWFPAKLKCTSGECEGEVRLELAATRTKHFEFQAHSEGKAAGQIRIEYDPWVRRKQELDRVVQLLMAIPSLLGTIGTFYEKMRGVLGASFSLLRGR